VDSGAAVHFIHADLVKELSRDTWNSGDAINIITVTKEPIGTGITHQTVPVTLQSFHCLSLTLSSKYSSWAIHG